MKNESQEWDDIHFGLEEEIVPDPNALPVDEIPERTFNNEDELEVAAARTKEDDDDLPLGEPAVDPNAEPVVEAEPPVSENVSGIEMYLAQFDIEGGMIQFEDGTATHFDELDPAKQAEVLQQLHSTQASTVESQYGLDENEIGLLNYLRENKLTVEEMVDAMVQEKVSSMMTLQELASEDYSKMDPDALYTKWLKDTSPEATAEQLASDLIKAKELSNYDKLTENLRSQFIAKQQESVNAKISADKTAHETLVETQRQEIVQAVMPMVDIAGIALDQNIKNTVLDHILETNEEGDSAFMDEVFSDPQSLFKAAFWYVYGESLIQQRDEYWKKEKSAAYRRGKEDALGVSQAVVPGRSFTTKTTKEQPHTTRQVKGKETSDTDWTDLHNE